MDGFLKNFAFGLCVCVCVCVCFSFFFAGVPVVHTGGLWVAMAGRPHRNSSARWFHRSFHQGNNVLHSAPPPHSGPYYSGKACGLGLYPTLHLRRAWNNQDVWGGGFWTWPKILLSLSWWQTNGACKIWSKNPVGGPWESSGLIQGYIMSIQKFDN
jgi:hypothetical protein